MKDQIFGVLQRVGRSFMLPIAILPVAGLLLGIGGSFTNETMLRTYGLWKLMGPGTTFRAVFQIMSDAGNIVFMNLPIIFAIGVAIGMAKKEKEVAALAAAIAFFIMHASIGALINLHGGAEEMLEGAVTDVVGITSLQMGVFGGIIVGLGVAGLHNRFYRIQLPQVLSFFGGTRFVPIISAIVYTAVGILMFYIWPMIQNVIYAAGNLVLSSGYFGTWVYGLLERLLIPFGLHHVFYLPFWQTAVGGTMMVNGQLIEGAQNIFFAQLADPQTQQFSVEATRFMAGKFPLMIFGLPGAALAMYQMARPEKKQAAAGLLLSAALTSMLTGITEPIEFTFLFVAPLLYGIHCVFAGLSYMLMHMFSVGVGMTFSGGLIDLVLFGVMQGNEKTNWIWIPIIGLGYFIVYYGLFSFLIGRLDLKTPGRENAEEVKLYRRSDLENRSKEKQEEWETRESEKQGERETWENETQGSEAKLQGSIVQDADLLRSQKICRGLGGKDNISDIDCCATRLRCTVYQSELVEDSILKETGASGVVHRGTGVQIIYGPQVTVIKSNLEEYLESDAEEKFLLEQETRGETRKTAESGTSLDAATEKRKESNTEIRETIEPQVTNLVIISSPITGLAADLATAPDDAFAEKMMGDGAVVVPDEAIVRAPEDGEVLFVFATKHAIGFRTESGIGLIIHIGIDTVKLDGKGFDIYVNNGQKVKKGEPMMRLDLAFLREHAPSLVSPVICTELGKNQRIHRIAEGAVKAGEPLFAVETLS